MKYTLKYLISKAILKLQIPAVYKSDIDKTARICAQSHIYESQIGRYSYTGYNCKIYNCKIGNFCSIAENCTFGGDRHPIEFVSSSPVFHMGNNIMNKNFSYHEYEDDGDIVIGRVGYEIIMKHFNEPYLKNKYE